jgi:hypothetical protein
VPENYFDVRIAQTYEARWPEIFDPAVIEPAVGFLAGLAGSGAALELGIGTGRLAIPLSQRGVRAHGIELSPDMVAELRKKPGADGIGVTIGDFATVHRREPEPHLGVAEGAVAPGFRAPWAGAKPARGPPRAW